jgi:hypothetical protein
MRVHFRRLLEYLKKPFFFRFTLGVQLISG